jgi:hypothetical protein
MSTTYFIEDADRKRRIAKLREEIKRLGGNVTPIKDMPAEFEEEFLRHVLEYETAQPTTLFSMLENTGLEMPIPDELTDKCLGPKLKETIETMATLGAYLVHTDHLSDRELYIYLFVDGLREEAILFPDNPRYAYIIDLTGSGSEEDNQAYLKYYADEDHRRQWADDWPDDVIPERVAPPFDRDRVLPKSPIG